MRPEDIIDGLGQVSDHMVQDAQDLKKSPRRSLKWGSLAACILCGVTLLGVCAVKLRNSDRQQSLDTPEPSVPPVVSEMPQDSSEEATPETTPGAIPEMQTINPEDSLGNVLDYQVVAREDAIYFVDPYIGLMSMNPETKETKTILPNGTCSLAESDGRLYCLNQANGQVTLVENGDVTTVTMLENMGPGYPFLQGVSNGYVCWMQDAAIYAASIEDGVARKILPKDGEDGGYLCCGVYQGMLYTINQLDEQLCCTALDTGETTALELTNQDGVTVKWKVYTMGQTAGMVGSRIYSMGQLGDGADLTTICICYDLSDGSLTEVEVPAEVPENADIDVWDGTVYLLNKTYYDNGESGDSLISYNPETGEKTTVLDETQTADMGGIISWWMASGGIYYTQATEAGLYYYDFAAGTHTLVYQSSGLYGNLVVEPNFYWQQGDSFDTGEWYEHFNEVRDYYDLTCTDSGVYFVSPAEGVYRYIPEEERLELLVSGKACRILKCDEGLYATCSDSGEVYEIQDGTARLLLTLEKDQKIAVKPIAVKDGKLYWNYYVTDLSTGETETDAMFRMKKSQPQILHDGKIYCLGGNGEIGYVDPTGGTESYEPLTGALGTKDDQWEVKFFDDCIIALQRDSDSSDYQVYQVSYEDGSSKWLGTVTGASVSILDLDGDTLYLEPTQDAGAVGLAALNITTGESETIMEEKLLLDGTDIQVRQGICYSVYRELGEMEFAAYDLETGTETTYQPYDSIETQ